MEDVVTYETTLKLKEKGFPIKTKTEGKWGLTELKEVDILPTISRVLKWFREEKNIFIPIDVYTNDKFDYFFGIATKGDETWEMQYVGEEDYKTYEQAALAGIEYVLENII